MDLVKIDGVNYDVLIMNIEESFEKTYSENTGRTIGVGIPMTLDCLGTSVMHEVTFRRKPSNRKAFDDLYDYLMLPRNNGITVEIIHNQTTIEYEAYCSSGGRELKEVLKGNVIDWENMTIQFIPMKAQYTDII